ncbi:vacuolar protein sorting-associated protein 4, putative [Plasmodium knowlesi strain H]|uniref:Vacuolar protein sorting-associated protein 4, putative n=3 Tax=Plasmodium knowlesi TaxID=5850 RepID=A0A5K1UDA9_PLAKH|nr:vacuolar protein sorting-associated protein 4, putative [Plasmodium knowlesi strain H]OTN65526.1 putative ATPase [Plasmodium knowlesi]CAA9989571.1 vacuolar protein sorting-associated protein 4, putative [Plasmodium knowlesi strain H]SBO22612.1 vacuolar protein sorting-associated protein 4, putative [Plasmodium knowlesi strain H]SBO23444.1 vacuolar protein sorting-associated protein 4, putative [Plasmodium knowlesi strain H]VVS79045.1 vacuolar protein sorting-associated protein 4, putative [|eukprot:XP_002260296.1 ATPase, putative [Plasmodium knowlesi strain H]
MDSEETINQAVKLAKDAVIEDEKKNYKSALNLYIQSLQYFNFFCKYEKNSNIRDLILKKMEIYMTRAEILKELINKKESMETKEKVGGGGASTEESKENMKKQIKEFILNKDKNVKWSDVCGLETAKEVLKEAIIFPLKFPKLFNSSALPYKGILLYGPPGTGKTFLALACSNECNMNFFNVSSSDLVSKYQGESEKYIKCLFDTAKEHAPAIIFIDEIDSLCGSRTDGENESTRRIKTEFLINMSGLNNYKNNIIVMGATNTPWSLDSGFRRRFEKRIYIPLPNVYARMKIFEKYINGNESNGKDQDATEGKSVNVDGSTCGNGSQSNIGKEDIKYFATVTENYTGADIDIICRDAVYMPVKKCLLSKFFKQVKRNGQIFYTPCSPGDPDPTKVEKNVMSLNENELLLPPLSVQDFKTAISNAKPSLSVDDLKKYEEWTQQYGMNGT